MSFKEYLKEKSMDKFANLSKSETLAKIANSGKDTKVDGIMVTAKQASDMYKIYDGMTDSLKSKFNVMDMSELNKWFERAYKK